MLHTDHYPHSEIRRSHLIFQTALMVIVIGVSIGFFSDSIGFSNLASDEAEFSGFKTVNISQYRH